MAIVSLDSLKQTPPLTFYLGLFVLWRLSIVIYRRYFHPLAKIPGPFLPAVTSIYEYYHNHIRKGQYYRQIEKLHQKYGTVSPSLDLTACLCSIIVWPLLIITRPGSASWSQRGSLERP